MILGLLVLIPRTQTLAADLTALDKYVAKPDTNYQYRLLNTTPGEGYTAYTLEMISQAWLTTNEVSQTLWKHWLTIVKPDTVTSSKSLLFITGGSNGKSPPKAPDKNISQIALTTKSVVTELKMVPNQPLIFNGETKGRTEDALIAYTWDKFLRTGDEKWPARLPMTKSAVRAMDTITSFCASEPGGKVKVDSFVVAGGSKRGWTTWTTAAVDKRVIAAIPLVIDMLNIEPSFLHHYAAYGFWSPAVQDYTDLNIMDWTGTPQYHALMKIEEPYEYRERLTMPKFIINASGDQFFLPDSSQFYFDDLPGTKYLRYVPNADHSLKGSDAWQTVLACYGAILESKPLPKFSWKLEKDGAMRVNNVSDPVYAPNSYGGPKADPARTDGAGLWAADGDMVRAAYTLRKDDDDWGQAGTLVRQVMDDAQRSRLVSNVAGHLKDGVSEPVLLRAFEYWRNIDKQIGDRIQEAVRNGG